MAKRKNPAFQYGATPKEAIHKLVDKAIAAGREGARDVDSFLSRSDAVTATALKEGAVLALESSLEKERSAANARSARRQHADAWKREFESKARVRWESQTDASHWTGKQMATALRVEWKDAKGDYPCKQSTAETYLKLIKAEINRRLSRPRKR